MTDQEKIEFIEKLWRLSKEEEIRRRPIPPEELVDTLPDVIHRNPKKKSSKNG
jgi:hypothetical protein